MKFLNIWIKLKTLATLLPLKRCRWDQEKAMNIELSQKYIYYNKMYQNTCIRGCRMHYVWKWRQLQGKCNVMNIGWFHEKKKVKMHYKHIDLQWYKHDSALKTFKEDNFPKYCLDPNAMKWIWLWNLFFSWNVIYFYKFVKSTYFVG